MDSQPQQSPHPELPWSRACLLALGWTVGSYDGLLGGAVNGVAFFAYRSWPVNSKF